MVSRASPRDCSRNLWKESSSSSSASSQVVKSGGNWAMELNSTTSLVQSGVCNPVTLHERDGVQHQE